MLQHSSQGGDALFDQLHVDPLTDDTGGRHQNVLHLAANSLGGGDAHPLGVLLALGGAGVGVAAVDDDGTGLAVFQVLLIHVDRSGLYGVFGEDCRGRALHVGDDEGHILLIGLVGLDAHMDAGGLEALCGADAAIDEVQHMDFLL